MQFDISKAAYDLALAYAKSEIESKNFDSPQEKLAFMLEEYCSAFGYFTSQSDEFIRSLIQRGE